MKFKENGKKITAKVVDFRNVTRDEYILNQTGELVTYKEIRKVVKETQVDYIETSRMNKEGFPVKILIKRN